MGLVLLASILVAFCSFVGIVALVIVSAFILPSNQAIDSPDKVATTQDTIIEISPAKDYPNLQSFYQNKELNISRGSLGGPEVVAITRNAKSTQPTGAVTEEAIKGIRSMPATVASKSPVLVPMRAVAQTAPNSRSFSPKSIPSDWFQKGANPSFSEILHHTQEGNNLSTSSVSS